MELNRADTYEKCTPERPPFRTACDAGTLGRDCPTTTVATSHQTLGCQLDLCKRCPWFPNPAQGLWRWFSREYAVEVGANSGANVANHHAVRKAETWRFLVQCLAIIGGPGHVTVHRALLDDVLILSDLIALLSVCICAAGESRVPSPWIFRHNDWSHPRSWIVKRR